MTLGNYLKTKRIERNLTIEKVAEYIGVPKGTVSKWETDRVSEIQRTNIKKLSEILNINPVTIVEWNENHTTGPSDYTLVAYNGSDTTKTEIKNIVQHILDTIEDETQLKQIKMYLDTYIEK